MNQCFPLIDRFCTSGYRSARSSRALGVRRAVLASRWPVGPVVRAGSPANLTIDSCTDTGSPGVLTVVTEGPVARRIGQLTEAERKKAVLDAVAERFGDKAQSPVDYLEQNWSVERYSGGAMILLAARARAFDDLLDVIVRCQEANLLPAGDPREIAGPTWSLLHGIALLTIGRDFSHVDIRDDPQALAERSLRALLFR